jgi:hypothetical protein
MTAAANKKASGVAVARPCQMSEIPKRTKVKRSAISAVVSPYSIKQSQSSTSSMAIVIPAAKAAMNPLPWTLSAAAKAAKATPRE